MLNGIVSIFYGIMCLVLGIATPQKFPPPLTFAEEKEYFDLLRKQNDENARQMLILHNLRLVSHIVRKYYSAGKNQDDLVSVGTIGLVKAVDTFDTTNGTRFATYAAKCIQNEILMFFRSQKKTSHEVSLNETIDVDRDGNPLTYIDVIYTDDSVIDDIDLKIQSKRLTHFIDTVLGKREKSIIVMRYGLGGYTPMTQREVAEKLGISRSYVSRIEKSALAKLADAFNENALKNNKYKY